VPYQVEVDSGRSCIVVAHRGQISLAESRAAQAAVFAAIAEHGIMRVLIDVTGITNDLSVIDLFVVSSDLDRPELPRPRGALVARQDQRDQARFLETVAANRGLNIASFTERDKAEAWLSRD
jgi:hypothetical protein